MGRAAGGDWEGAALPPWARAGTRLGDAAGTALAEALKVNKALQSLDLSRECRRARAYRAARPGSPSPALLAARAGVQRAL